MYNLEIFFLIVIAILSVAFINVKVENSKLHKDFAAVKKELKIKKEENIDFNKAQEGIQFLDNVIKDKFNYHKYSDLFPAYLDNKVPEKKLIHELKNKIYISVVGGLSQNAKNTYLRYFNQKGMEIYIHEKIMILMNETDFKSAGNPNNFFLKNINKNNISIMTP